MLWLPCTCYACPAHVMSAIAAYPFLSCNEQQIMVPSGGVWPITEIYCAGKETTYSFIQDVLDEVVDLFPSKYIHIGGDEATKTNWKSCKHCQLKMKMEEGMEMTTDEIEMRQNMKKRSDMVSKKLGELLLRGYRMLNSTCEECGVIITNSTSLF